MIRSKESLDRAFWGFQVDAEVHTINMLCDDFSQLSPMVRLDLVFSCNVWLQVAPWCFTLDWQSAVVPPLDQPY